VGAGYCFENSNHAKRGKPGTLTVDVFLDLVKDLVNSHGKSKIFTRETAL
jgi:hypothetical protein